MPGVNLLVDLDDGLFAPERVHHEIEALDRERGIYVSREHRAPERILGFVDRLLPGTASFEASTGGVWIAERAGAPIGFASFDLRGLGYRWLRTWSEKDSVGVVGPLAVAPDERNAGVDRVLLHAALFSLRERGYRQAVIAAVDDPLLATFFETHAHARVVETARRDRPDRRFRATVLASGNGSNFAAVAAGAAAGELPLAIAGLVANDAGALALRRAAAANVPASVVAWDRAVQSRDEYDASVLAAVAATEPDLVLLLGWMHVLDAAFIARFPESLNLHPAFLPFDPAADAVTMPDGSLLPAFRGAHAFDDAVAAGRGWSGATVHRISVAVDRGAVYARVPVRLEGDDRAAWAAALAAAERFAVRTAVRRWGWERP